MNSKVRNIMFDFCPSCAEIPIKEGKQLCTSTFDGYFCAICGRYDFHGNMEYGRYWEKKVIPATLEYAEDCDCGDQIRHYNGGNYHTKYWVAVNINHDAFIKRRNQIRDRLNKLPVTAINKIVLDQIAEMLNI